MARNGDQSFWHRRVPEMVRGVRNGALFLLQLRNRYGGFIDTSMMWKAYSGIEP